MSEWNARNHGNWWEREALINDCPDCYGDFPLGQTEFIRSADLRFTYYLPDGPDGSITIADYHGHPHETILEVPEEIDGHCVTCINWAHSKPGIRPRSFNPEIVRLPESVCSIGQYAFDSFYSLKHIEYTCQVLYELGCRAFANSGIEEISLPLIDVSCDDRVFESCHNLRRFTARGKSFHHLGSHFFSDCHALTEITLPDEGEEIFDFAFHNCFSLSSVAMPSSLNRILDHAFSNCYSLRTLTLPRKINTIGPNIFAGCQNLTHIFMPWEVKSIHPDAFSHADTPNAFFCVKEDSSAEAYCRQHRLRYIHI